MKLNCANTQKNYDSEFIFVEKFPGLKRPFYAMDSADDPKLAESFDLLFRGLEITTGGQRIHDYNELLEKNETLSYGGGRPRCIYRYI